MKKLLFISLLFFSCTSELPTDTITQTETSFSGDALIFLDSVKVMRQREGLKPLKPELGLTNGCISHSYYMWVVGYPNHNNWGTRANNSHAVTFSEVVCGRYLTPQSMFSAYISSPEHRKILMDSTKTHIGIGITDGFQCVDLASYKK